VSESRTMSGPTVLDRDLYAEAEAARLLRVPQGTLHYWLEGGTRRGKSYPPIIRPVATGSRTVTWAEFVEAGLLRTFRKQHHVQMAELRRFIEELRDRLGVPYPLAHERMYVSGKLLVMKAQIDTRLDTDFCLVATINDQLILTSAAQEFVERVTWTNGEAATWRPHADPGSPVQINPDIRFGAPSVAGISTEVLWEHDQAGEDVSEIAEAFGLTTDQVWWALSYESSARSKQPAAVAS
jgi:uncharacterized protein (DUF433 family)